MRSRSRFAVVSTLVLSLALVFALNLSVAGKDSTVSASVPSAQMSFTIDSTSYDFGTVDQSDINTGYVKTSSGYGNVLTVKSNDDWALKVTTTDSDLGTSSSGDYTKPLEDFKFKASNKSGQAVFTADITSFTSIDDNTEQTVASGGNGAAMEVGMDYKILLDYEDEGGDYSVTLTYTLAAQ